MKLLYATFVALFLVAGCGSGGSDGSTPPGGNGGSGGGGGGGGDGDGDGDGDGSGDGGDDPSDTPGPESAAGLWTGADSTGHVSIACLVTSAQQIGCRQFDSQDDSTSGVLGQLFPDDETFTGSGKWFTAQDQTNQTGNEAEFSGSFVSGETLIFKASFLDESYTFLLQYGADGDYETPSSLEIVSGQYEGEDLFTGNTLEIDITNDGTVVTRTNSQAGSVICNGSGQIAPVDPRFNEYLISSLSVACTGEASVTFEGVATLNTYDEGSVLDIAIAAPDTMVIGSIELVRSW